MKKTIIVIVVLGLIFAARFCSHTVDIVHTQALEGTECSVAVIDLGNPNGYAVYHGQKLVNGEIYDQISSKHGIIIAHNEHGYRFYNRSGNMINNLYYDDYDITARYAIFESRLGKYIYTQHNDILSIPYQEVIPQGRHFAVKDVNGWGVLDKDLECIIPTEYASLSQLPQP